MDGLDLSVRVVNTCAKPVRGWGRGLGIYIYIYNNYIRTRLQKEML